MTVLLKKDNGEVLLKDLKEAEGFYGRFKGLMGKTTLPKGEGLRISPCSSIHCFFMKMNIDVLFLDEQLCVVHTEFGKKPWTVSRVVKGSASVIEAESGAFLGKVKPGECLIIKE